MEYQRLSLVRFTHFGLTITAKLRPDVYPLATLLFFMRSISLHTCICKQKYNWWFIGDSEGLHALWFTIKDPSGQVSQSNEVTYRVLLEDCTEIANFPPSSRYA